MTVTHTECVKQGDNVVYVGVGGGWRDRGGKNRYVNDANNPSGRGASNTPQVIT